ncbi:metallophosphoesterase family protein [Rhizobium leguminosarum]|uniref:metallophosphoesterase family protein n=1 Tax=Rhizobium leguminosarum TaxID=384 RepID=UPI002E12430C|nr:metallophosphoesterase [Rhizobium leguminosarum]WSH77139.1 metallophosphoesterase [Rhizobium leguminosarum]
MTSRALIFGDNHGSFREVKRAASFVDPEDPPVCIFVGDFDLERPLEAELKPLLDQGCEIVHVHGNHDAEPGYFENLFGSALAHTNVHASVVEIDGVRIAGLGGTFLGKFWHPHDRSDRVVHQSRRAWIEANPKAAESAIIARQLRCAIFPEDYDALSELRADVLLTHEAPSVHRYGFEELDLLAEIIGANTIIHGHHHRAYDAELSSGVRVIGMGKADMLELDFDDFRPAHAPAV